MRYLAFLALCLCTILGVTSANAGPIADSIAYQGQLNDASNNPVPDGVKDLILSIWTDSTGGTMLYSQTVAVTTSKGLFSTCIGCGSSTLPDIFTGQTLFLQTQLTGQPAMTPRTRLRSVPYAMSASSVHGEYSDGTARSKGIVAGKPGSGNPNGFVMLLDADSDGDGHPDYIVTDTATTSSGSRALLHDSDDDGIPDQEISQTIIPGTSSVAIRAKGTGADKDRSSVISTTGLDSALFLSTFDANGDGVDENRIAVTVDSGGTTLNMKTKTMKILQNLANETAPSERRAGLMSSIDSDGDGVPDVDASLAVTPTTSSVAIKTKGTGADKDRSMSISGTTDGFASAVHRSDYDDDGDGVPEQEISQTIVPGTSSVAIKTKGTGADPNRVITTTTPDSVVTEQTFEFTNSLLMPALMKAKEKANRTKCSNNLRYQSPVVTNEAELAVDSAGSGLTMSAGNNGAGVQLLVNPSKGDVKITASQNSQSLRCSSSADSAAAMSLLEADSDDDGIPEGDIAAIATPMTSSVAIKTKGTGADKDRTASITSSTTVGSISTVSSIDDDGDGVADQSIEESISSGVVIAAWLSKKGYDYYQSAGRNSASLIMRDSTKDTTFFVDGNGRIGVGKPADAVKRIDVIGGAYCDGTNWVNASDANAKENFQPVDGAQLLEKISGLEITRWNYKGDSETEHIGPTAQDFKETFGVGSDGKSISTIDPSGIALAAIKELNSKLKRENRELRKEMDELRTIVRQLKEQK